MGWRRTAMNAVANSSTACKSVPSPPCGMATYSIVAWRCSGITVPSPPCGMATRRVESKGAKPTPSSEPTVWDGDMIVLDERLNLTGVPSPPCGMATNNFEYLFLNIFTCSEPTVWDGDQACYTFHTPSRLGSEPTVWDGDHSLGTDGSLSYMEFRAHRVGWRPQSLRYKMSQKKSSEPTVWDGDKGLDVCVV